MTILSGGFSQEYPSITKVYCFSLVAELDLRFTIQLEKTMSTHEIQHLICHKGQFTFVDGKQDEGMIISRYNISAAQIEYYFIPSMNVIAYQAARSHSQNDAHKKLGMMIDIGNISHAKLIN